MRWPNGRLDFAALQIEFRFAGRTSPLTDAQAAKVAADLTPALAGHPKPQRLTITWRTEPVEYI